MSDRYQFDDRRRFDIDPILFNANNTCNITELSRFIVVYDKGV